MRYRRRSAAPPGEAPSIEADYRHIGSRTFSTPRASEKEAPGQAGPGTSSPQGRPPLDSIDMP
jgi:hypothetical protein